MNRISASNSMAHEIMILNVLTAQMLSSALICVL